MSSYSGNTYGTGRRQKAAGLTGQNRQTPDQTATTPSPAPTPTPSAPTLRNAPGSQSTFSLLTGPGNTTLPPASPMQKLAAERTLGGGRNLEMGMAKFGASSGKENFNFGAFQGPNALPNLSASGLVNSAQTDSKRIGPMTKPVAGGSIPEQVPEPSPVVKAAVEAGDEGLQPNDEGNRDWGDIENFYNDLMAQSDQDWEKSQEYLQNEMGAFQRQADLMNARMGRGIAGGYAQLQGAAMAQGMEVYGKAALEHNAQRRQSQLAFLDRQIAEMNAVRGREWQQEDWDKQRELELIRELISSDIPYEEDQWDDLVASLGLGGSFDSGAGERENSQAAADLIKATGATEGTLDAFKASAGGQQKIDAMMDALGPPIGLGKGTAEYEDRVASALFTLVNQNGEWPSTKEVRKYLEDAYGYNFASGGGDGGGTGVGDMAEGAVNAVTGLF